MPKLNMKPLEDPNEERETPPELFKFLADRVGPFDLDVCATAGNAKCASYFDRSQGIDGLVVNWSAKRIWCNPPYSAREAPCARVCHKKRCVERAWHAANWIPGLEDWIDRALYELSYHRYEMAAMLTPVATSTDWWGKLYDSAFAVEVVDLAPRVKFLRGGVEMGSPGFDSAVWVLGRKLGNGPPARARLRWK